jgi:peptide/nickel transport system permease protein
MFGYFIIRLFSLVPVLFGVSVAVFLLLKLVPGDLAVALLGPEAGPKELEDLRHQLGLDQPTIVQYWLWLQKAFGGDLGHSLQQHIPVVDLLTDRFQNTLILTAASLAISITVGLIAGVVSATRPRSILDRVVMMGALFGNSMPAFWLGILLIVIFAAQLGWLPSGGMYSIREGPSWRGLFQHLILPALTLGLISAGIVARLTRSAMLEALGQDYVRTARSKGLAEIAVVWKHTLKNAALPIVTIVGTQFGFLLGGAVLTETVFAWPGVGLLMYTAIGSRDLPVIQGGILSIALAFTSVNLITDLVYGFLDPRIRYGKH